MPNQDIAGQVLLPATPKFYTLIFCKRYACFELTKPIWIDKKKLTWIGTG